MKQTMEIGNAVTERKADIVFCLDATYSMDPCFDALVSNLNEFMDGLSSHGHVDWRFRLIAYRDCHSEPDVSWDEHQFTDSAEIFKEQLSEVAPSGGADLEESTLDALYKALRSNWRTDSGLQRVIVLMTDADSHPKMSPLTYRLPDNDHRRIIQEFQTMKHSMLFMVAPKFPIYQTINDAMTLAKKKVYFKPLPVNKTTNAIDVKYMGLRNVNFKILLKQISESISASF